MCGVIQCAVAEIALRALLHFDHELRPVGADAHNVKYGIPLPFRQVLALVLKVGDIADVPLREQVTQELQQQVLVHLRAEQSLESPIRQGIHILCIEIFHSSVV